MNSNQYTALPPFQPTFKPFVYIVDSPSSQDLFEGYSIGMALRDALKAIKIPCIYTLATDQATLNQAMIFKLQEAIQSHQPLPFQNAYPFIHLCMHGAPEGIALTNGTFIGWPYLRQLLLTHNAVKGSNPNVCMASCNGIYGSAMAQAHDSAFNFLIGNSDKVYQSDLTVGYLTFYHHFFNKAATVEQAIAAMKIASGDQNFYLEIGEEVKKRRMNEMIASIPIFSNPTI